MNKVEIRETPRNCKCKLCGETIGSSTIALVMRDVHISPHYINLWFHLQCIENANKDIQIYKDMISIPK